jgi:membrane fusion protein (multidrug efflux system)
MRREGRPSGGGDPPSEDPPAAVPVEVANVTRQSVSAFLETNGVLEAENDVNIVARTAGPIVELAVEEGMHVTEGQLLLRIDDTERRADLEIAKVALEDASRAHERAKAARDNEIISQEVYDQALTTLESAQARLEGAQVLYDYTKVLAPFDGIVVERFVKLAENVTPNQNLFRITDFDPLLCKIQVPEKELSRLRKGQRARIDVEAWPDERFEAEVLRISPVVEAATGTIRVTLQVHTKGKLSPGMFASVFLETDVHQNALVIPKRALSLESLSDTVFVVREGQAERRNVELGFEERDAVEVLSGLEEGARVIVVGQDGLAEGTPVQVLKGPGAAEGPPSRPDLAREGVGFQGRPGGGRPMDFSQLSPEQLERVKSRMRDRGMTEEQIEEAIRRRRQQREQ